MTKPSLLTVKLDELCARPKPVRQTLYLVRLGMARALRKIQLLTQSLRKP